MNKSTPLKRPIYWILDWDGTITQKDTLNALVNIAASAKPDFPTQSRWQSVVDAYMSDYTSTLANLTTTGLPTTLTSEKKLLQHLKAAEQRSLDRVFASQIFTAITTQHLEQGARDALDSAQVCVRPGFVDFFHALASAPGSTFHILSVNWSRQFIASCLSAAGISLPLSSIVANELDGMAQGPGRCPSTGEISPEGTVKIISSGDKLCHLNAIREENKGSVVYVGDSWPDIECLVEADVGICIRDEEMGSSQKKLAEALGRVGIGCDRLGDGDGVVWARDFVEIKRWAEGC
ncbi:HAD-like domain-containing protein [Phaeosphaeria sp. MPI-PUGE-AT-0046c]|nr:HAD-like domain-containing protein [Phaeosphaeria sp. MPI-PUGE-AT-0046c]